MTTGNILGAVLAVVAVATQQYYLVPFAFAVGNIAGDLIDPQRIHNLGPRLTDLAIQISSYGAPIPILYGTQRFSGNIIWSSDLIEAKQTHHSGKGGPSVSNTTFSYSASFAVLLCEGVIDGVVEIRADNNLVYSAAPGTDAVTMLASGSFAKSFRVYKGDETQMPDPLIESYVGVGNCPAYRGSAYIVFEEFQFANYGNRIPQISCVVVANGVTTVAKTVYSTVTPGRADNAWISKDVSYFFAPAGSGFDGMYRVTTAYPGSDAIISKEYLLPNGYSNAVRAVVKGINPLVGGSYYDGSSYTSAQHVDFYDLSTGGFVATFLVRNFSVTDSLNGASPRYAANDDLSSFAICRFGAPGSYYTEHVEIHTGGSTIVLDVPTGRYLVDIAFDLDQLVLISAYLAGSDLVTPYQIYCGRYSLVDGSLISEVTGPSRIYSNGLVWSSLCVNEYGTFFWSVTGTGFVDQFTDTGFVTLCSDADGPIATLPNQTVMFWTDGSHAIVGPSDASSPLPVKLYVIQFKAITGAGVALSVILQAECNRRGVLCNVSGISDIVYGYLITKQMTSRAAIEFLLSVYRVDAVESGATLVFVKRGGAPARTLTLDDLGAHEYGTTPPDPILIDRKQEIDLPQQVTLNFTDKDNAYQQGSVIVQRLNTSSEQKVTLDITALALTATEAAKIADIAMMEAWVGRDTFRFATTYEHADLEPTDVVLLNGGDAIYRVRITKKMDQAGGMIQWEGIADDAFLLDSTATSSGATPSASTIAGNSRTQLVLMDIPILRDEDDNTGFYARLAPITTGWKGGSLYRTDGAMLFEGSVTQVNPVGIATTLLPAYGGIESFDEANTVDVQIFGGASLSSVTRDQASTGQNAFLIGDEIVAARNATLLSAGKYRLSGLLRYQRGTEGAVHAVNERVVSLGVAGTLRVDNGAADIGKSHTYAAISTGRAIDTAGTKAFTNTGRGRLPFTPVQLGYGENYAGGFDFKWRRRTRLQTTFGVEAPLGELIEAYRVDFSSTSDFAIVSRSIFTSAQYASVTPSERTTLPNPFYWQVVQIGSGIGSYPALPPPGTSTVTSSVPPDTLPNLVLDINPTSVADDGAIVDSSATPSTIVVVGARVRSGFVQYPDRYSLIKTTDDAKFNLGTKDFSFAFQMSTTSKPGPWDSPDSGGGAVLFGRGGTTAPGSINIFMLLWAAGPGYPGGGTEVKESGTICIYFGDAGTGYGQWVLKSRPRMNDGRLRSYRIIRSGSNWLLIVDGMVVDYKSLPLTITELIAQPFVIGNEIRSGGSFGGLFGRITLKTS